jgi:hypothetical protein
VVNVRAADAAAATAVLKEAVLGRNLRHAGGVLLDQVEDVQVRLLDGREVIHQAASAGAVPAVKAAAWALWAVSMASVEAAAVF